MGLLFRYLKPFTFTLIISIAFLFMQVLSDLGLPRLMSDMVDTGIQAGGIKQDAPDAMSADAFELLTIFLAEEDEAALLNGYVRVDAGMNEEMMRRYPVSATQDIYKLSKLEKRKFEEINSTYTRAVHAIAIALQGLRETTSEQVQDNITDMKLDQIYTLVPVFKELKTAGKLDAYISAVDSETMAGPRATVMFTHLFYDELELDLKQLQRDYILQIGLKMLGLALLGGAAAVAVGWFAAKIGTTVALNMRRDIFKKVSSFSSEEYDRFSTASLITRNTNDVQQIQQLILMGLRLLLFAPIMGVGGIVLAVRSSLSLSWIIAVAVISVLGVVLLLFSLTMPKFKILQKLIDKLNLVSRDNLSGMMVIRAFGNEEYEENRFEQANDHLRVTNRFIQRSMAFLFPAMTLIMNLIMLLVIWVGAKAIADSELQIGNMMAFMQYAMQIIMSFLLMSMMFMMVPRALVSAERIQEVLSTELSIRDPKYVKALPQSGGITIEFKEVSYQFGNSEEPALQEISFMAYPGQTTAIIGTTGAGKSTLVNLLPRFYDVSGGQILLNGIDIRELGHKELRELIGYVPQKNFLFSGNIESNVLYGKESVGEDEIREVLQVAQASGFIGRMPDGIASMISQGGTNVSGGQRQRLAIARALVKRSPVYIFDDSFSALDLRTDAALRIELKRFMANATILVVAQRVSTIKNADQIIVLDKGRIVGKGTHHELLESCETYRDIVESQFLKEEIR